MVRVVRGEFDKRLPVYLSLLDHVIPAYRNVSLYAQRLCQGQNHTLFIIHHLISLPRRTTFLGIFLSPDSDCF
jgi:hypothetical protein